MTPQRTVARKTTPRSWARRSPTSHSQRPTARRPRSTTSRTRRRWSSCSSRSSAPTALATRRSWPISLEKNVKKEGKVTYYRDVKPILQNRCQECHRPGQVGPFSLMTYKQAVNWAQDIKEYTASRKMPPWKVSEGLAFHSDRRLS